MFHFGQYELLHVQLVQYLLDALHGQHICIMVGREQVGQYPINHSRKKPTIFVETFMSFWKVLSNTKWLFLRQVISQSRVLWGCRKKVSKFFETEIIFKVY